MFSHQVGPSKLRTPCGSRREAAGAFSRRLRALGMAAAPRGRREERRRRAGWLGWLRFLWGCVGFEGNVFRVVLRKAIRRATILRFPIWTHTPYFKDELVVWGVSSFEPARGKLAVRPFEGPQGCTELLGSLMFENRRSRLGGQIRLDSYLWVDQIWATIEHCVFVGCGQTLR